MLPPQLSSKFHELSNLLTRVVSTADLLIDDLPSEGALRSDVEQIQLAGTEAAKVLAALKELLEH